MGKLSFMKWYPADWINDTRELSPEAKAAWIDLLCLMWNAPARGVWKGTFEGLARATGLPLEMAKNVVPELGHKVSRVTIRDNEVTLENRRMVIEDSRYKYHAKRQSAYRERQKSDTKVTPKTLDVRRYTPTPAPPRPAVAPPHLFEMPAKKNIFTKPTAPEVSEYAKTIGFVLDGQQFIDYYEARGWQFKKGQPMKSWKAAVSTWKRNGFSTGGFNDARTNRPESHVKLTADPERARAYSE